MKRFLKQLTAIILAIVMTVTAWTPEVLAALLDNDPELNREILSSLEALCGSPEEAEGYYAILQQYGLLDEEGNAASSWTARPWTSLPCGPCWRTRTAT